MTRKELDVLLVELQEICLETIENSGFTPEDTHNLKDSIRVKKLSNNGFEIYIDTTQAWYTKYTLGPWVSEQWNGKTNPNEGWLERVVLECKTKIIAKLKGVK